MELQPGKNFTIVRQLGMPGDVATYYVQAVVKNSSSGAVITTVNLTDNGSQRFTGSFQVPADTSGQGTNIDITTTVYTDSGYTTQSNIYTIDNAAYLIFDRLLPRSVAVGGFGGDSTDYQRIQKMIDGAIKKIVIPEAKEMKETDLSPVLSSVDTMKSAIAGVLEKSVKPLNDKIQRLQDSLNTKVEEISAIIQGRAEFTETDLSPLMEKVDELRFHVSNMAAEDKTEANLVTLITTSKNEIIKKIDEKVDDANEADAIVSKLLASAQELQDKRSKKFVAPVEQAESKEELTPTPKDYLEEANVIIKD